MTDTQQSILVVEDEPKLGSLYTGWLDDHEVTLATDGDAGYERAPEADLVFLDRHLPCRTGQEVLEDLREDGYAGRVVMVTAVEPDFDIIEMGFDDYLVKPVTRTELRTAVERMATRDTFQRDLREYFSLASKKAVLETEKTPAELRDSEAYADLDARIAAVRAAIDDAVLSLDADWPVLLRDAVGEDARRAASSV